MNPQDVKRKLDGIDKSVYDDQAQEEFNSWAHNIKQSEKFIEASKHEAIKEIIQKAEEKIRHLKAELQDNENLTEEQRKECFRQRNLWEWFVNFFRGAQDSLKTINTKIEEELE